MDRARLPGPLRHYGGEVHALRRAGLGGVKGGVGDAGVGKHLPEGGGEFTGGEGDPSLARKAGASDSCWRALYQTATGQ